MILAAMILEARILEAKALSYEHPSEGCADPIRAAALYRIAALTYAATAADPAAAEAASRAATLKANQAEQAECQRREAAAQTELF